MDVLIIASTLALANPSPAASPDPAPTSPLAIRLKPRMVDGKVAAIDVRLQFRPSPADEDTALLTMPLVNVMAPSTLANASALVARDDRGIVPLRVEVDQPDPTGFGQGRRWHPMRPLAGDVVVTYSARPREITPQTRPGPLYDTRTEGAGFYGAGSTLLALPAEDWPRKVRISWDLSEMPPGSRGVTSVGEGDVETELAQGNLSSTFFMAGPVRSHPEDGSGRFVAYWITPPAFDLVGAARWTERAYDYFQSVFGPRERPFRVFMRTTERFQGGGSGGFASFIFGTVAGQDREEKEVRGLLAHEALHSFTGGGGVGRQWYSEGSTSYYTIVLPYRAGLVPLEDVQEGFNDLARAYYTNPQSRLANDEVTRLFFSDPDAQVVPYQRGPLYFALVDARLRAATNGDMRVDDLVRRFIERDADADPEDHWRALVREALGEPGAAEFDAMMAGAPLDLPSDLLGPCFRGEAQPLARFHRGFRLLAESDGRTYVRQLRAGSAAAEAGAKEGDLVLNAGEVKEAEDSAQGTPLTLRLRRGDRELAVTYSPWSELSPGQQWVRTEVPEERCAI